MFISKNWTRQWRLEAYLIQLLTSTQKLALAHMSPCEFQPESLQPEISTIPPIVE